MHRTRQYRSSHESRARAQRQTQRMRPHRHALRESSYSWEGWRRRRLGLLCLLCSWPQKLGSEHVDVAGGKNLLHFALLLDVCAGVCLHCRLTLGLIGLPPRHLLHPELLLFLLQLFARHRAVTIDDGRQGRHHWTLRLRRRRRRLCGSRDRHGCRWWLRLRHGDGRRRRDGGVRRRRVSSWRRRLRRRGRSRAGRRRRRAAARRRRRRAAWRAGHVCRRRRGCSRHRSLCSCRGDCRKHRRSKDRHRSRASSCRAQRRQRAQQRRHHGRFDAHVGQLNSQRRRWHA